MLADSQCLSTASDQIHTEGGSLPVQDALDSIEFISGPAGSRWGSERAAMGRAVPWNLTYMAIGNEVASPSCLH